ncbi:arylsulfatase [Variovorax boronicumulans]|uniref:sulfatase family protein n=1 Tax=Variovorax boronicumulans TaxID=436515 RepID=UPI003399FF5E
MNMQHARLTRPNFLIFITDQQRADHLGCYGNATVRTPHIDELARMGTRFDRAYVANPVCMPNRGSIMTSRMPSVHGARSNGVPLPLESVTFADLLGEAGYHTALIGKSHLQNMEDVPSLLPLRPPEPGTQPSQRYAEARRETGDPALYEQERRSSWERPDHRMSLPYYGFQDVVLCNNHADECFGDYLRWLQKDHPDLAQKLGRQYGLRDPRYIAPQAWRTQLDEFTYPTHFVASQASHWIRQHVEAHEDQPFALMCSFPDPHHPWTPPGRYWDMYDPADMPVPKSMRSGGEPPPHVRWLMEERRSGQAKLEGPRLFAASAREVQEMIALTYGMITNIDDRVGMVMETLRATKADDNTVVIFTSDHGDLMGDHGIVLKGPLHYQGLIRVPLIWREPQGSAATSSQVRGDLVSSIDLPASILQRASIAPPNGIQGRPLVTPTGMQRATSRDAVLIEENQQRAYLGFEKPVRVRTIVTTTHRLSLFSEGVWGELYDLLVDQDELVNLWDEPSAQTTKSVLLQRLGQLLIEHSDTSPRPTHLA